ncbi:hypothetical protein BC941DRAFT_421871 [Chlamydoabsidia padenii]|nr:hypothetical protein BC941DRAFT_421871 [Chlamydoabsidia padenii]
MNNKEYDKDPHSTTKRMRMTLACERCRNKKVRCDATHPECGRFPCSYTGTATQFDIYNLAQLNDTITKLSNKVDVVERQLQTIQQDTKTILRHVNTTSNSTPSLTTSSSSSCSVSTQADRTLVSSDLKTNWALSLTPTGLRIDTNIVSLQDLYGILLSGASELQRQELASSTTSSSSEPTRQGHDDDDSSKVKTPSSKLADHVIVTKTHPLYRSKGVIFPLYSAWESTQQQQQYMRLAPPISLRPTYSDDNNVIKPNIPIIMNNAIIDQLFHHYAECFLCYPLPDIDTFLETCRHSFLQQQQGKKKEKGDGLLQDKINSLLVNAILAWAARHAAIYHDLFPGQDPNRVGEHYFDQAKILLRDCFLASTLDTVHALLLMYIYSIGKTGSGRAQAGSEAYVFLGLAIRMAVDMGLHRQPSTLSSSLLPSSSSGDTTNSPSSSPSSPTQLSNKGNNTNDLMQEEEEAEADIDKERTKDLIIVEKQRRLFSAIEFMETLCASHSDKPMMLPPTDEVTIGPPTRMLQEQGEQRYRVEFTIHRHQISQIDRSIHTTILSSVKNPRLSSISHLERQLKDWYDGLPSYFQYERHRNWCSTSFREQACLKLTFEYHFQMCQLYSMFLPRMDPPTNNNSLSAIALLSLRICVDAADSITDLLDHWAQLQQPWCHFTLGTLVMACGVYCNYQLRSPSSDVVATAKRQMLRIHTVLKSSPVRHHKYVRALMERIERYTKDTTNNNNNETDDMDLIRPGFETTTTTDMTTGQQVPYPQDITPVVPSSYPSNVPIPLLSMTPSLVPDTNWSWFSQQKQQMGNRMIPEALVSPTTMDSAFEMANDVHLYDLFKFADFVYTPTMDHPQVNFNNPQEQDQQQTYSSYHHPSPSL